MMATKRLTEEEVHTACTEISAQGERPTALNLLDKIGRGSLTTISKYLTTWNSSDAAQALNVDSLPVVAQLPEELSKDSADLIKKIWNMAKGIADNELDIQREALKQAEITNQLKVEEAFKFSEAQALKIERLEDDFLSIKNLLDEKQQEYRQTVNDLNAAEKSNVGLSKDNEQLQHEIDNLQQQLSTLSQQNKILIQEKNTERKEFSDLTKQKDNDIKKIEIDLVKSNEKLTSSVNTNNKLIADLNDKTATISSLTLELEETKNESKTLNKNVLHSIKEVEHLRGQLEVFKLFEKNKESRK